MYEGFCSDGFYSKELTVLFIEVEDDNYLNSYLETTVR